MTHLSPLPCPAAARPWLLALLLLLAAPLARAQAPAWGGAATTSTYDPNGTSTINAMATDASGNVFVTGSFTGQVLFGSTLLTCAGYTDLFVAKYVPGTGTWAWAQSGGGTNEDYGVGIAVSGTSVYVSGSFTNSTTNTNTVLFGGTGPATGTTQVNGVGNNYASDLLLLKYTDNGSSATLRWNQVGGAAAFDYAGGVAVSGTSVYMTGSIFNNSSNAYSGVFGASGTMSGTNPVRGASPTTSFDLVLARYTDSGNSATLNWVQVGGGSGQDAGYSMAVSGTSVYVTGSITNNTSNAKAVTFGGNGTAPGTVQVNGATPIASADVLLAKYTDNGTSATLGWTQVGGGTNTDAGNAVAVSGNNVYVAGTLYNSLNNANIAAFGGSGTTAGTAQVNGATTASSRDLLLAKYTDNGTSATLGWTQVGGGTGADQCYGMALSGTSLYVACNVPNDAANSQQVVFGGGGTTAGTTTISGTSAATGYHVLLARYQDNGSTGSFRWGQPGNGSNTNIYGVATSGQQVYAGGSAAPPATFGPTTVITTAGGALAVLPYLTDAALLPTYPAAAGATSLTVCPNPTSHGAATLTGTTPGAAVQVLDALGRVVATTRANAAGTAALPGLPAGLYVVRAGARAVRLSVK